MGKRGGAGRGQGRKTSASHGREKKKSYSVTLYPTEKEILTKKFGSLTKAIKVPLKTLPKDDRDSKEEGAS